MSDNPIESAFAPWRNRRSRWPVEHHLAALDQDFEQYFSVCAQRRIFSGPSIHFYERTIDIVRRAPSPDALAENPAFYDFVYATLTSWGMHRMGEKVSAKLTEFDTFSKTLRGLIGAVDDLYGQSILDLGDEPAAAVGAQIGQLAATEGVTASTAPLVANTKTLHFILPDLVPPMDRTYTGRFFFGPNTGLLLPGPTSDTVEYMFTALHRLARRHAQFLRNVTGTSYLCLGHAKGLDNATIGYVLSHPRAFPKAGRGRTAEPD